LQPKRLNETNTLQIHVQYMSSAWWHTSLGLIYTRGAFRPLFTDVLPKLPSSLVNLELMRVLALVRKLPSS